MLYCSVVWIWYFLVGMIVTCIAMWSKGVGAMVIYETINDLWNQKFRRYRDGFGMKITLQHDLEVRKHQAQPLWT